MKDAAHSKLIPEVHANLVASTRLGLTRELCANSVGITRRTLQIWMKEGKKDIKEGKETKYSNLFMEIKRAEAELAGDCLKTIHKAAREDSKHWTAAAWLLERRYKDYRKKEEIKQHHSGSIDSLPVNAIDDRVKQLLAENKAQKENDDTI